MSIASQLSFSTATSILAGTAGSILYQSAVDNSTFLPIGTNGYVLTSNGSAPTWTIASGVTSGTATNAINALTISTATNASFYPTFVNSNSAAPGAYLSYYTTSSFAINPNSGNLYVGNATQQLLFSVNSQYSGPSIIPNGSTTVLYLGPGGTKTIVGGNGSSYNGTLAVRQISGQPAFTVEDSGATLPWLYVNSTGNVGINTSSPTSKLHIYSTGTSTSSVSDGTEVFQTIENSANGRSGFYGIGFRAQAGFLQAGINAYNNNIGGASAHLTFWTRDSSAAYAERMRIDGSGYVSVGTTSTVISGQTTKFLVSHVGAAVAAFNNSNNTNQSWHHFIYDAPIGTAGTYAIGQVINGSTGGVAGGPFTPILNMAVPNAASTTPKVFIDTSGNVGIGVTPSTTSTTTTRAIEFNYGNISTYGGTEFDIASNAYIVNTGWVYKATAVAALYQQSGGAHSFQTVASGTAGTAASFTERMKIDNSGNLLFNSGYGSAATAYGCRSWVNFNGTTVTPSTIRGSGNVSSITHGGTGIYRVNFSTAMTDVNYSVACSSSGAGSANGASTSLITWATSGSAQTSNTSYIDIWCYHSGNQVAQDDAYINVAVFR